MILKLRNGFNGGIYHIDPNILMGVEIHKETIGEGEKSKTVSKYYFITMQRDFQTDEEGYNLCKAVLDSRYGGEVGA